MDIHKSTVDYLMPFPIFDSWQKPGRILQRSWNGSGGSMEMMIQIHDDLNDTMAVPANPDWLQKRKPLPILFAMTVEHPDRARFLDLYHNMSNESTLQEAQEILKKTPLPDQRPVDTLFEGVIAPVRKLFETLGVSPDTLSTVVEPSNQE